jgi:DNA topoisomerase-1
VQQLTLKRGKIAAETQSLVVGADRNKLVPTGLADIVTDFLVKYFGEVIDYDFTAKAEKELDDIEEGSLSWQKMLEDFYKSFHPLVKKSDKATRQEASQMRKLGTDPKTKLPVFARYGRYGPVLQMGESGSKDDKEAPKPKFAPMPTGSELEEVTLAQALPMFNLPRVVGKTAEGEEITADIGPYGPYLKVGKLSVSLKEADPLTIKESEARELINQKIKAEKEKHIANFGKIQILNGPYGPYVTDGKINARIPKEKDPKKVTQAEAKKLLEEAPKKGRRWPKKPAAQSN